MIGVHLRKFELISSPASCVRRRSLYFASQSTEPYLLQYISLDLRQELLDAGFKSPEVRSSSPRHRTCVAYVDK